MNASHHCKGMGLLEMLMIFMVVFVLSVSAFSIFRTFYATALNGACIEGYKHVLGPSGPRQIFNEHGKGIPCTGVGSL